MCNINTKTKRKTVTVYKAVELHEGKYYSFFAGTLIELGTVKPKSPENTYDVHPEIYRISPGLYNENMVGKCSGFKDVNDALILVDFFLNDNCFKILKMTLGGEIWAGDSSHICEDISDENIVYAGTKILSFEKYL